MSRKIPGAFLCLTPFLIEFLNISVERLSEEIQADTFESSLCRSHSFWLSLFPPLL